MHTDARLALPAGFALHKPSAQDCIPSMPEPLARNHFASDNYAGIAPEAWNALAEANRGHVPAYGEDPWTEAAADRIRELFDHDADIYFTATGSAANSPGNCRVL